MAGIASARTGKCQYVYWQADTPSTNNRFGRLMDADLQYAEIPEHTNEVGGLDAMVGKMIVPAITVNTRPEAVTLAIASNPIEDLALRAGASYPCSALTPFRVVAGSETQLTLTGCKVNSIAFSCQTNGILQASLQILALAIAEGSYSAPTITAPGAPMAWYNSTVAVGGSTYGVRSYTLTIDNGLTGISDLETHTTNYKRFAKRLIEGNESVKLEVTTLKQIPLATLGSVADDITSAMAFSAVHADSSGHTFTITMASGAAGRAGVPFVAGDGLVEYPYSFECAFNVAANRSLTYAA